MKKILNVLLVFVLIYSFNIVGLNVYATDQNENAQNYSVIVDKNYDQETLDRIEAYQLKELQTNVPKERMNETVTKWVYKGRTNVKKTGIGYAGGQKVNGTVFTSQGGFYWQDGGYNANITISCNIGVFGVSLARGKTSNTGVYITSPYVNKPCKLYIYKDLQVTKYAVYQKNKYESDSMYRFVGYKYATIETRDYLEVRKV